MKRIAFLTGAAAAAVAVSMAGGSASAAPAHHEAFGGSASAAVQQGFGGSAPFVRLGLGGGDDGQVVGDFNHDGVNMRFGPGTTHGVWIVAGHDDGLDYQCSLPADDGTGGPGRAGVWDRVYNHAHHTTGWVRDDLVTWPGHYRWCR